MKTKPMVDPAAAFPDPKKTPRDEDLNPALGRAFVPIDQIFAALRDACPQSTHAWQYSNQAGWYHVALLKKRRLFYLVPKRGDFRLSLILGGKAIASLQSGPQAERVAELLKTAKRYPEGTAFEFTAKEADPVLLAALIRAKLAH